MTPSRGEGGGTGHCCHKRKGEYPWNHTIRLCARPEIRSGGSAEQTQHRAAASCIHWTGGAFSTELTNRGSRHTDRRRNYRAPEAARFGIPRRGHSEATRVGPREANRGTSASWPGVQHRGCGRLHRPRSMQELPRTSARSVPDRHLRARPRAGWLVRSLASPLSSTVLRRLPHPESVICVAMFPLFILIGYTNNLCERYSS